MNRLWRFFSRVDLAFWLLIAVSVNLFVGVVVSTRHETVFKKLNSMLMPAWVDSVASRPWLYLWIFTLFVLLLALAVNTVICLSEYVKTLRYRNSLLRKISIILFHLAFVLALGGHCVSEFIGYNEQVILDAGTKTRVPGTGITIEALEVEKITRVIDNEVTRMGIAASLKAVNSGGDQTIMKIQTMHPRFQLGYTFHLSFMDKGLGENQARLIVRRDYGLLLIILAGLIAFIAIVLYGRYTLVPLITQNDGNGREQI